MYKISTIVPVYNGQDYIKFAIESILKQTFADFEIIIIDDGSVDNTKEICQNLVKKDSRIKYFYKKNGGAGSARNLGIEKATGEYIHFLDSDDWIHQKTYEIIVKFLDENDLDMCYFGMAEKFKKIKIKGKIYVHQQDSYINNLIKNKQKKKIGLFGSASIFLAKTKLVKKINFLENHTLEDIYFTSKLIKESNRIGCFTGKLYYYNQNNLSSVSTNKSYEKINDILYVWELLDRENKDIRFVKYYKTNIQIAAIITLFYIYKNGYEFKMQNEIKKCKKILKGEKYKIIFFSKIKVKYKFFLFAYLILGEKIKWILIK